MKAYFIAPVGAEHCSAPTLVTQNTVCPVELGEPLYSYERRSCFRFLTHCQTLLENLSK